MVNDFFEGLGLVINQLVKFGQEGDHSVQIHLAIDNEMAGAPAGEDLQISPYRWRSDECLEFLALFFS
jgi:hypothetical protein